MLTNYVRFVKNTYIPRQKNGGRGKKLAHEAAHAARKGDADLRAAAAAANTAAVAAVAAVLAPVLLTGVVAHEQPQKQTQDQGEQAFGLSAAEAAVAAKAVRVHRVAAIVVPAVHRNALLNDCSRI